MRWRTLPSSVSTQRPLITTRFRLTLSVGKISGAAVRSKRAAVTNHSVHSFGSSGIRAVIGDSPERDQCEDLRIPSGVSQLELRTIIFACASQPSSCDGSCCIPPGLIRRGVRSATHVRLFKACAEPEDEISIGSQLPIDLIHR